MSDISPPPGERPKFGLSLKLITMIVVTILGVEVLIYLPSVANFRASWLDDRVRVGGVAARVIDVVPEDMNVPAELAEALLRSADAVALVIRREGRSELIERPDVLMPKADVTADMRERNPLMLVGAAIDTLAFGGDRIVRIIGNPPGSTDTVIELLMSDAALRDDMLVNSRNIFILSLLVAAFTSLAIYIFLDRLLVRPFGRITANMIAFRETPENASRIIDPSRRRDEIGIAERELAALETDLFEMLHQRKHLA
ncbi:MAG: sensor histidine kinase, partial [Cucumibacter sp.]